MFQYLKSFSSFATIIQKGVIIFENRNWLIENARPLRLAIFYFPITIF